MANRGKLKHEKSSQEDNIYCEGQMVKEDSMSQTGKNEQEFHTKKGKGSLSTGTSVVKSMEQKNE